jgi:hypothetical protein
MQCAYILSNPRLRRQCERLGSDRRLRKTEAIETALKSGE